MAKAQAEQKAKEIKAAEKAIKARGVRKPKHVPQVTADTQVDAQAAEGVDTASSTMVNSGFSIFNQQDQTPMEATTEVATDQPATEITKTKAERDAEAALAKIAAKAAKQADAEARKQKRDAEKAEKEARKAERAATAAVNKEQREKLAAELAESGRKYTGSMLALAERVKAGVYVKSMTGQLRSTDELAVALDAVPPANVVHLGCLLFEEANRYTALNVGQQSMNYRNRMRGAIKAGKFTLDHLKEVRDAHGLATAEAEIAAKAEAKAAKLAEREAAKAAKREAAKAAKGEQVEAQEVATA
jgi:hypothetical protein